MLQRDADPADASAIPALGNAAVALDVMLVNIDEFVVTVVVVVVVVIVVVVGNGTQPDGYFVHAVQPAALQQAVVLPGLQ